MYISIFECMFQYFMKYMIYMLYMYDTFWSDKL